MSISAATVSLSPCLSPLACDPRINPIFLPGRICRLSPEQCHNREFLRMFFFDYITKRKVVLRIGILFLRESWQTAFTNKTPFVEVQVWKKRKNPPLTQQPSTHSPFFSLSLSLSLHFPLPLLLHLPLLTNTHSLITSSRSKTSRIITNIRNRLYATRALVLQKKNTKPVSKRKKKKNKKIKKNSPKSYNPHYKHNLPQDSPAYNPSDHEPDSSSRFHMCRSH